MFTRKKRILLFVCCLISDSSFSALPNSFLFSEKSSLHPVLSIDVGAAIAQTNQSQLLPVVDSTHYSYSSQHTDTQIIWGSFIGAEWIFNPEWALQIGLSYHQPSTFTIPGTLTQGVDTASSNQFNYNYKVLSQQWLIESKLLMNGYKQYHPYILVGIGEAINKAYHYQTNVPPSLTFTPMFAQHTNHSFSYAAGIGVDTEITPQTRVGIGYRFTDLGRVDLGNAQIDMTPIAGRLKESHLYTHELLLQFSYILF